MKIGRLSLGRMRAVALSFGLAVLIGLIGNQPVHAQEFTIVVGHTGTPALSTYWAVEEFKYRAEKYSGGRIKVEVHHSGSLGSDKKLLESVAQGTLDVAYTSNGNYAHVGKAMLPFDLPYLVYGRQNDFNLVTGPLRDEIAARVEKDGFKYLMMFPIGGPRNIFNSRKEVKTPADAKGIKMRVVASPINQAVYGGYGFQLVVIPWSEVYTSLKQGIVEGLFSNSLWSYQYKHTEVAKHITMTGGIGVWHIGVMNLDRWNELPADLKAVVDRASTEAEMAGHMSDIYLSDKGSRGAVTNHKAKIYHPTKEELKQWIDPALALWDPLIEKLNLDRGFIKRIQDAQIPVEDY